MQQAYFIDEGILLTKDDAEFYDYAIVYDKKYGYYDECQDYVKEKENAIKRTKKYVEDGVDSTYAIVSIIELPDNFNFRNGYIENIVYSLENVVYSVAKINGKIVENFLEDLVYKTHILVYARRAHEAPEQIILRGTGLEQVLLDFLKECIETDDTGIFFELESANIEELEKDSKFHKITLDGKEYGIMLYHIGIVED